MMTINRTSSSVFKDLYDDEPYEKCCNRDHDNSGNKISSNLVSQPLNRSLQTNTMIRWYTETIDTEMLSKLKLFTLERTIKVLS